MGIHQRLSDIQVGVLTVAAILILTVGMLWFKNVKLSGTEKMYQVDFVKVEGLRQGDKVQVRGIRMGEVKSLSMLATSVRVEIALDGDVVLTDQARIVLGEKGIVGQIVLEIDPGTGAPVQEGHIFQGETAGTIASMTDAAGDALAEMRILTRKVTELVDEVKESGKVVQTLQQAHATLTKIDGIVDEQRGDMKHILENLAAASDGLRDIMESGRIERTLDDTAGAMARADSLMQVLADAGRRLEVMLAKVDEGDGALSRMLNDPLLYDRADSTMASVKRLVDAMRRNPKRYFKLNVVDF